MSLYVGVTEIKQAETIAHVERKNTMNARAQAIELRNDSGAFAMRRLVAAAMLAILLLNATFTLAHADSKNPFPGTQNDFTNQCRSLGGSPHREATHVVSCTWPNGGKQTCDFNQKPNSCTYTPPPKTSPAPNGNVASGSVVQAVQGEMAATDCVQAGGVLTVDSQVPIANGDGSSMPAVTQEQPADETPLASADETASIQAAPSNLDSLPALEEDGSH